MKGAPKAEEAAGSSDVEIYDRNSIKGREDFIYSQNEELQDTKRKYKGASYLEQNIF